MEGLQVINCWCTGNGSVGRISPRYWTSCWRASRSETQVLNTFADHWSYLSETHVLNTFDHQGMCITLIPSSRLPWHWTRSIRNNLVFQQISSLTIKSFGRTIYYLRQYMLNCWSTLQPDTREWLINWSSIQKSSSTGMLIIVAMALEVMALWTGLCLHWRQSYFTTPTGRPSYPSPPCSNIVNPFLTPQTSLRTDRATDCPA